jgi:hypothetical protein
VASTYSKFFAYTSDYFLEIRPRTLANELCGLLRIIIHSVFLVNIYQISNPCFVLDTGLRIPGE